MHTVHHWKADEEDDTASEVCDTKKRHGWRTGEACLVAQGCTRNDKEQKRGYWKLVESERESTKPLIVSCVGQKNYGCWRCRKRNKFDWVSGKCYGWMQKEAKVIRQTWNNKFVGGHDAQRRLDISGCVLSWCRTRAGFSMEYQDHRLNNLCSVRHPADQKSDVYEGRVVKVGKNEERTLLRNVRYDDVWKIWVTSKRRICRRKTLCCRPWKDVPWRHSGKRC